MNEHPRQPSSSAFSNPARTAAFAAVGIGAGAALALLARGVSRRDTAAVDHEIHQRMILHDGHPLRKLAEAVAPAGKWWSYVPAAGAAAVWVFIARSGSDPEKPGMVTSGLPAGAAILSAAVIAAGLNQVLEELLPQPPAPPGRSSRRHPVFPSGHTFGTASVTLTAAYVLVREGLVSGWLAFPLAALVPVTSAAGRLIEEKHWISDVAGGFLAAIAVGSLPLALYEAYSYDTGEGTGEPASVLPSPVADLGAGGLSAAGG